MLSAEKIEKFMDTQASLGRTVRGSLRTLGFEAENEYELIQRVVGTSVEIGVTKAEFLYPQLVEAAVEIGEEPLPPTVAACYAAAVEALLVGLAIGFSLGIVDEPV